MVVHKLVHHLLPLAVLTAFSLLLFLPLLRQPFSVLVEDYDGAFITWTMTWVARSLLENPSQLYQAPIFAPLSNVYTFSDPLLSGALIGLPIWLLTKEPIVFSTVNYLLAGWLTAIFSYLLLKDLTNRRWSSVAGALLISYSSIHFTFFIHLHTFMIQGIPLGLWAWWRFSRTQNVRRLILWAGAFLFQTLNSPLTGYLFLASHGLYLFDKESREVLRKKWRWVLGAGVVCAAAVVAFYLPYLQSANVYHSQRSIRDAAHFAASLNTWWELGGKFQLTFLAAIVMVTIAFSNKMRRTKLLSEPLIKGALVTAAVCFILSLGPVLKWSGETVKLPTAIPLPYAAAYYVVPGMKAFRTPERWFLLSGLMMIIALVLIWRNRPNVLLALAVLLLLIEQPWSYTPTAVDSRAERAAVYSWFDQQQPSKVLFMPTFVYDDVPDGAKRETHRMLSLISATNIPKLVNGYSGYAPQETLNNLKEYNQLFPHPEFWQRVRAEGIEAVVVETDSLTADQRDGLAKLQIPAVYTDAQTLIYYP